jgi:phosphoenolpyruvate synthase/pyruvate phosphate dikinase
MAVIIQKMVRPAAAGVALTADLAREYGIPAVVGCGDATARLRTGMRVTVDGATGNVEPDEPRGGRKVGAASTSRRRARWLTRPTAS